MQLRNVLSLVLALFVGTLAAQDLTSPMLTGSWQSTFSNPALLHQLDGKLTIGLPGIYNEFTTDNFTFNDFVVDEGGQRIVNAAQGISVLEDRNQLRDELRVETIGFAWKGDKLALGFSHRNRFDGVIDFPKSLAQVIFQGNAQFIGQTVDIAPYFQLTSINDFSFSAAYKINDQISIGGSLHYLSGAADLSSSTGKLELTTSDDIYQLQLNPDYVINAAGTIDYQGFDDIETNIDPTKFNLDNLGKNSGIGFDFGVQFDLDRIRIQASALDIGSNVKWTEEVTNLTFNQAGEFGGLDVLQNLLDDEESITFDGILDTLETQFMPDETSVSYTTNIASRYLVGADFDVTDAFTVGALAHMQQFENFNEFSLALSARYRILDLLSVGGVYSYRPNSAVNIGVNALAQLGPVNLLLATDNILTAFNPADAKQASIRLGLSLSFGREEE